MAFQLRCCKARMDLVTPGGHPPFAEAKCDSADFSSGNGLTELRNAH